MTLSALMLTAGTFCGLRILRHPGPQDPMRYHHHLGDGASEMDVINSHAYWSRHGYLENGALPCLNADITVHCQGYTHYPPLPQLLSSWLFKAWGDKSDFNRALRSTRATLFLLNSALSALAIAVISVSLALPVGLSVAAGALLGLMPGYWLYADHLYGHGSSNAILGIFLAMVMMTRGADAVTRRKLLWMYGGAVFLSLWIHWETAPAAWLLPGMLCIRSFGGPEGRRRAGLLLLAAVAGSIFAIAARLAQNAWALGGLREALTDWGVTALGRSLDIGQHAGERYLYWNLRFLYSYVHRLIFGYIFMIGWWGGAMIASFLGAAVYRRSGSTLSAWVWLSIACVSWNWIMWQHSFIHYFTLRFAVWSAVMAMILLPVLFRSRPDSL